VWLLPRLVPPVRLSVPPVQTAADTLPLPDSGRGAPVGGRADSSETGPAVVVRQAAAEPWMRHQVHFVSDFVGRLNYQLTPDDQPFDSTSRQLYPRQQYVRMLFDEQDVRLVPRSGRYSPLYEARADQFAEEVSTDTAQVYLSDPFERLFAQVRMAVEYRGKPEQIQFFLKQFHEDDAYLWRIIGVQATFLRSATRSVEVAPARSTRLFIASNAHETQFLDLFNHLRARRNLLAFVPGGYRVSAEAGALAQAVRAGAVVPTGVEDVRLYLDTRRRWVLGLGRFVRETENSGWLIADLFEKVPGGDTMTVVPTGLPAPLRPYLTRFP
jgi:hypothetical protein